MHAGITGNTSGTVFNVAGTRVGVHVLPSGSNSEASNVPLTPRVALPTEVRISIIEIALLMILTSRLCVDIALLMVLLN